jgi:hypothetical protein
MDRSNRTLAASELETVFPTVPSSSRLVPHQSRILRSEAPTDIDNSKRSLQDNSIIGCIVFFWVLDPFVGLQDQFNFPVVCISV